MMPIERVPSFSAIGPLLPLFFKYANNSQTTPLSPMKSKNIGTGPLPHAGSPNPIQIRSIQPKLLSKNSYHPFYPTLPYDFQKLKFGSLPTCYPSNFILIGPIGAELLAKNHITPSPHSLLHITKFPPGALPIAVW